MYAYNGEGGNLKMHIYYGGCCHSCVSLRTRGKTAQHFADIIHECPHTHYALPQQQQWLGMQTKGSDRRGREVVSERAGAPCRFGPKFRGPREATGVLDLGHPMKLCLRSSLRGPGAEERENLGKWDSHSIDSNGMNIRTEEQTLPFPLFSFLSDSPSLPA